MFERYTEEARRAIFFACHEALWQKSAHIETHHLLMGLLRERQNKVNQLFRLAAHSDAFRKQLKLPKPGSRLRTKVGEIPLALSSKRALAYTSDEADQLHSKTINTGHLLLGLLRECESDVLSVLASTGIDLESVRTRISEDQGDRSPEKPQTDLKMLKPLGALLLLITVIAMIYLIVKIALRSISF